MLYGSQFLASGFPALSAYDPLRTLLLEAVSYRLDELSEIWFGP